MATPRSPEPGSTRDRDADLAVGRGAELARDRAAGFTLVELMIASCLGLVVLLYAGGIYGNIAQNFQTRSQAAMNQQDVTLLSYVISHTVRSGASYRIYVVPDRGTPADSGNGLAIFDPNGTRIGLMEWSPSRSALVDSLGSPLGGATIQSIQFSIDPALPRLVHYRYTMDAGTGTPVNLESSVSLRN